jgi:hypothetical protein
MSDDGKWSVRDTLTGAIYPQPNKIIAEKVAEMHGNSEVIPGWPGLTPSVRARITVEMWDENMNYALESIWVGEDPEPGTDEYRAVAAAMAMRRARFEKRTD